MKPWLAFFAGAACVGVGVFIGRDHRPITILQAAGPILITRQAVNAAQPATSLPVTNAGWVVSADPRLLPANSPLLKRLPSVRFSATSLEKAFDTLRDEAGLSVVVNWHDVEATGIDRSTPISLQLQDVTIAFALGQLLKQAGDQAGLTYWIEDGVVMVGTRGEPIVTVIYDITPQLAAIRGHTEKLGRLFAGATTRPRESVQFGSSDVVMGPVGEDRVIDTSSEQACEVAVINLIVGQVDMDSWRCLGGSVGDIEVIGGYLVVTQTLHAQDHVQALLALIQ
jgi:hypothetical protein